MADFPGLVHPGAVDVADALVAQAHTEGGDMLGPKWRMTSLEMPASLGVQGPGDTTMPWGAISSISLQGDLVVAVGGDLGPQFPTGTGRGCR